MTMRKQVSKRRWKARIEARKWIPKAVVFALDREPYIYERWDLHPTESDFLRLRRSAEVVS
jgi:hypothetical protein